MTNGEIERIHRDILKVTADEPLALEEEIKEVSGQIAADLILKASPKSLFEFQGKEYGCTYALVVNENEKFLRMVFIEMDKESNPVRQYKLSAQLDNEFSLGTNIKTSASAWMKHVMGILEPEELDG